MISVSCLDLTYSVKLRRQAVFKDEKKDETSPVLLQDLVEEDSDQGPLARVAASDSEDAVSLCFKIITQQNSLG